MTHLREDFIPDLLTVIIRFFQARAAKTDLHQEQVVRRIRATGDLWLTLVYPQVEIWGIGGNITQAGDRKLS